MISRALTMAICTGLLPVSATASPAVDGAGPMIFGSQLLVETVEDAPGNGTRRIVHAQPDARSGDRLIFLIRYRNSSANTLPGYEIVAQVPAGVRILPDRDDSLRVSADGGKNWARPDAIFRFDAQGHLRPATDVAPTHVRLRLNGPIAPGETGTVAYRGELL